MQKISIKRSAFALAATIVLATVVPALVNAQESETPEKTRASQRKEAAQANLAEKKAQNEARLEEKKLEICKKREANVNKKMSNIVRRAEKQLGVFTKISDRTKTFYAEKNRTLANYDALIAEVDAKKLAAESALGALKVNNVEFKCDGTDPKGAGASFRESQKTVIAAMKEYKSAVKNLIVGVKSANAENTSTPAGGTQ